MVRHALAMSLLAGCGWTLPAPIPAPDASVADIGSRFGLTDAAHFSRLFKQAYGAGPREYRRRLQVGPTRRQPALSA